MDTYEYGAGAHVVEVVYMPFNQGRGLPAHRMLRRYRFRLVAWLVAHEVKCLVAPTLGVYRARLLPKTDLLHPVPWRPDDTARDARHGKKPDDSWQPHPESR